MSFYSFNKDEMKYYLNTEYRSCNVQLYYTSVSTKSNLDKNQDYKLWDKVEEKILRPDKDGCFLSLETDSFIKHTKIICYYFGLIENDIYSNVINQYSHLFETFDVYSQLNGFVINYIPQSLFATISFSRRFCKNIICSFSYQSGDSNIKSSNLSIGLSNVNVLDNHITVSSIEIASVCNYLYQYFVLTDWKLKMRIDNRVFESTDSGAKGEFKLIKDKPYLHMTVFSKNIIRCLLIQRNKSNLNFHNLVHKLMYRHGEQLFLPHDTDIIDTEANACVLYVDLLNNVRCYNINKKKVDNFQYILITTSTEINEKIKVTLYTSSNGEKEVSSIGNFHLYDKTCVWIFKLEDSRAFSWYKVTDDEVESKKNNFYDVTKFVNDFRNPICLL